MNEKKLNKLVKEIDFLTHVFHVIVFITIVYFVKVTWFLKHNPMDISSGMFCFLSVLFNVGLYYVIDYKINQLKKIFEN